MKKIKQHSDKSRRSFIKSLFVFGGFSLFTSKTNAATRTPRSTEGPFYPTPSMRFSDNDNDLVKISGKVKQAGGEIITLKGRVLDTNSNPIKNARVEIWQCDVNGHYLHTGDSNASQDEAFQGFGHSITDDQGVYSFRTIKPVSYPGRTPHIHVKAFAKGRELTTQFYLNDHPQNENDFIYGRMSKTQKAAVGMTLVKTDNGLEAVTDIVI